eukprot:1136125-Pelagomonas_calceolata.AAC.3
MPHALSLLLLLLLLLPPWSLHSRGAAGAAAAVVDVAGTAAVPSGQPVCATPAQNDGRGDGDVGGAPSAAIPL